MLDGAGYGDNPKAFFFTLGLQEAVQFAQAVGGRQETLYGFSGVGDLVLTSMGKASRNREIGYRIGRVNLWILFCAILVMYRKGSMRSRGFLIVLRNYRFKCQFAREFMGLFIRAYQCKQ